jgi:hypothetical protein
MSFVGVDGVLDIVTEDHCKAFLKYLREGECLFIQPIFDVCATGDVAERAVHDDLSVDLTKIVESGTSLASLGTRQYGTSLWQLGVSRCRR